MRTNTPRKTYLKLTFALFTFAAFFPLVFLIAQSLAANWRFPKITPPELTFRAWNYLFDASAGVQTGLMNSLILAVAVTFFAVALALPAARALALHEFRGKNFVLFIMLLPILSPAIAAAIGEHALFLRLGITDSWTGVALAHLIPTVPYCVLTLTGSFSRFDTELEIQARNLGANRRQIWQYVTLPSITPGILTAAFFAFLISWSQYLTTLLIGGGKIITLPMLLINFQRSGDEAVTAALTLTFLAPTIIFLILTAQIWREN